jgi:large subunit ribosomal protein L19e
MNLKKKKILAQKVLKVGKARIVFLKPRLEEIKEAITKQDIRDLYNEGAISIKEIKGKKKFIKRKSKGVGRVKKNVSTRKEDYMNLIRKQRKYIAEIKNQGRLTTEEAKSIRKKIRNKDFRSLAYLKEYIRELRK